MLAMRHSLHRGARTTTAHVGGTRGRATTTAVVVHASATPSKGTGTGTGTFQWQNSNNERTARPENQQGDFFVDRTCIGE